MIESDAGWLRGASFSLQLQAIRFLAHRRHHLTCAWSEMDRVVLSAYTVNRWECISSTIQERLESLGFGLFATQAWHITRLDCAGLITACSAKEWFLDLGFSAVPVCNFTHNVFHCTEQPARFCKFSVKRPPAVRRLEPSSAKLPAILVCCHVLHHFDMSPAALL